MVLSTMAVMSKNPTLLRKKAQSAIQLAAYSTHGI